jgi:hypothetical protein
VFVSFEQYQPDVLSPSLGKMLRHPWNALRARQGSGSNSVDITMSRNTVTYTDCSTLWPLLNRAAPLFSDDESRALLAKLMAIACWATDM